VAPLCFLLVEISNPGFNDKFWGFALMGVLLIAISFLIGVLFTTLRHLRISRVNNVHYRFIGLTNLYFGIVLILGGIMEPVWPIFFFFVVPIILVGCFMIYDAWYVEKEDDIQYQYGIDKSEDAKGKEY
jgi:hypothetical protein